MNVSQEDFIAKAKELLGHNPEALDFICVHNQFVHVVDDLVDVPDLSSEDKAKMMLIVWKYYQHPYYLKHASTGLSMLTFTNHAMYEISVKWEKSNDKDKVLAASILRHNSITVLFAVIALECGVTVANTWAEFFFEHTFYVHKADAEFKVI